MSAGPPSSTPAHLADDPSIPLLTDRIYLPAVDLDTALPASLAPPPAAVPDAAAEAQQEAAESPLPAGPQGGVALADAPAAESARADDAGVEPPIEVEVEVEVELDRDLVAASDADFDALLSAEPPVAAAEDVPAAGPIAPLPPLTTGEAASPPLGPEAATEELPPGPPPAADSVAAAPPPVTAAGDETAIEATAGALRESVLQRVMARLPEQVNATVRDLMQPAIEQAMARLGDEAELALRIALQELVEQALRDELAQRPGPPRS